MLDLTLFYQLENKKAVPGEKFGIVLGNETDHPFALFFPMLAAELLNLVKVFPGITHRSIIAFGDVVERVQIH